MAPNIEPSPRVQAALAELGAAIGDEPFKLFVICSWPDLTATVTLTNIEEEREALALLKSSMQRVRSGEWKRERGVVDHG